MRTLAIVLALAAAAPAFAADAPAATRGAILRDSNSQRIGRVEEVRADGSVGLIIGSKYVIVPGTKVSMVDGKLTTSLTKREVSSLR